MAFVHLHLHTEYSLLDGECRIATLPAAVKKAGQSAVAITDHGVLYGAAEFYKACKREGVKPIIGCEVYLAPRGKTDKTYPIDSKYSHLVLLAKNEKGYANLVKIVSDGFVNGFYQKPRTDRDTLEKYSDGLIALSGCISGLIPQNILQDNVKEARENALFFDRVFGRGNYYLEMQRHGLNEQNKVNQVLVALSRETGIPLVATNDVHYTNRTDSGLQKLLMAVQMGKSIDESDVGLPGNEFYLKSSAEMDKLFADLPEAIENTQKIADACNYDFEFGRMRLPAFTPPAGENGADYLLELCEKGFAYRFPHLSTEEAVPYRKRMEYELSIIGSMGFTDYYLIVWDFVAYARRRGITVGPGRGSGVGSLCAYLLQITDVDPLQYGLLFERFLNPERVSMPDFDIDFCDERRGEVIDYVSDKYGRDHVAQIVTFGTLACRQAVRDTGRALGMPYASVDAIAKHIPRYLNITLKQAKAESPSLRALYDSDPQAKTLLDYAEALEGRPRNTSTHATGVVITDTPITDHVPLATNDNVVVTQFPMNTIADLGLLKIDFLGLRFLSIIDHACALAGISVEKIPFDDPATYDLLSAGNTLGLFQLESEGMRSLLVKLRPRTLEDIVSAISLYRPGPMQFIGEFLKNRAAGTNTGSVHPALDELLAESHGCILYQEQVMQICRKLAGYSYGRADILRRAMSKKDTKVMENERSGFVSGAGERGIPAKTANHIFDMMSEFANYAFNKSHAVAYAVVACRTAYLKCHFPREYMCALLNTIMGSNNKVKEYIDDCARMAIKILPPDVNHSMETFSVSGNDLRFGLAAIKHVGGLFAQKLIAERERGGFKNPEDFLTRVSGFGNLRMIESLILSGALDCFGIQRSRLMAVLEDGLARLSQQKSGMIEGQIGLFDSMNGESGSSFLQFTYPSLEEFPLILRLKQEKELTGLYFSGHPLDRYRAAIRNLEARSTDELFSGLQSGRLPERLNVRFIGLVTQRRAKKTKNGNIMAFVTAEDLQGEIEIILFPAVYEKFGTLAEEGAILLFEGEIELKESFGDAGTEELKLLAKSIRYVEIDGEGADQVLYLKATQQNRGRLEDALAILREVPGHSKVRVYFEPEKKLREVKDVTCLIDENLLRQLRLILGNENVAIKSS